MVKILGTLPRDEQGYDEDGNRWNDDENSYDKGCDGERGNTGDDNDDDDSTESLAVTLFLVSIRHVP